MSALEQLDAALSLQYGPYASFATDADPIAADDYGDGPAAEIDRLLDELCHPRTRVLDLGCGAGFSLCRLAPRVASVWGLDSAADLLEAAQARIDSHSIDNATLVLGSVTDASAIDQLPDGYFDLVLARRGPNVNGSLLAKLTNDACVVQEMYLDPIGLLEFFGRKGLLHDVGDNPHWLLEEYTWLGLRPVSVKDYYFDFFFKDADHLARYLSIPTQLLSYPMPRMPYSAERDRAALEVYARYNATPRGVRVINRRQVFLFRRERVQYAPAAPEAQPQW